MSKVFTLIIYLYFTLLYNVIAGPISYAVCQSACNAGAVLCYISSGSVFGVGSIPLCNSILGSCMTVCVPLLLAPTP